MTKRETHAERVAREAVMIALCVAAALTAGYFFDRGVHALMVNTYENVAYAVSPNAARADAYGEQHFDPNDPADYDLDRSLYFFKMAAAQDPGLPFLYHEMARIEFLQGNFSTALADIDLQIVLHGDSEPAAYYVRGLIEGYMGDYGASAADYQDFLQFQPNNWAAKNDEAWVLLKAQKYEQALTVIDSGLLNAPSNAWLLNSKATALYELGDYKDALVAAQAASVAAGNLTPQSWSIAYPGNDPTIATQGLSSFRADIQANIHTIEVAQASSTIQSK